MADVNRGNRPLSPFMLGSAYRFQWTSATSILTRITGNALIVGTALIVWWLLAASVGPGRLRHAPTPCCGRGSATSCCSARSGRSGTTALAGIRHLVWDIGPDARDPRGRALRARPSSPSPSSLTVAHRRHPRGPEPCPTSPPASAPARLGAAHEGAGHHWRMIVTSVMLVGLVPLFVFTLGPVIGRPYPEVVARPVAALPRRS